MRKTALAALGLAALVLALDQASKQWILDHVRGHSIVVVPGFFNLVYAENTSAAFGILHFLPEGIRLVVLTGLAVVISVVLLVGLAQGKILRPWSVAASGLVIGGALGNALDRVRHGFVVDFIDWHIAEKFHWNVFNVADSAIVVAAAILFITSKKEQGSAVAARA